MNARTAVPPGSRLQRPSAREHVPAPSAGVSMLGGGEVATKVPGWLDDGDRLAAGDPGLPGSLIWSTLVLGPLGRMREMPWMGSYSHRTSAAPRCRVSPRAATTHPETRRMSLGKRPNGCCTTSTGRSRLGTWPIAGAAWPGLKLGTGCRHPAPHRRRKGSTGRASGMRMPRRMRPCMAPDCFCGSTCPRCNTFCAVAGS